MRRNWTQLALVSLPLTLAAIAVLAVILLFAVRPRRVMASKRDCDRIEIGMSREQVEQILGGPPGDYRTRPTHEYPLGYVYRFWEVWKGDGGVILIDFEDGTVHRKAYDEYWNHGEKSLLDRMID
jgi:SmpA / OmlA family